LRDLVVMLADGGDALRHMKVLDGQSELFGAVAAPGDDQPHHHRARG
jgi:hypothetical protein